MRIPSIQNYYCTNYTNVNPKSLNKGLMHSVPLKTGVMHQDTFVKTANTPSFTGVEKNALVLLKQIPLGERIASLFTIMKQGDILITAPTMKGVDSSLKGAVKKLEQVVKKCYFVPEDNLQTPVMFYKNTTGEMEVMNLSKTPVILKDGHSGKSAPIMQHDSFFVVEGDELSAGDWKMPIRSVPKANLSLFRKNFSKLYDFTDDVSKTIQAQNSKTIGTLLRPLKPAAKKLSFTDVGGQDKALEVLQKEVIFPIKYPEAFRNTKLNHGFIMYGPPGTGKSLTAEALANETNANFIKLNGLEMESKWVGESEENWRVLFDTARENQPTVIFIDEFDAVAKKRGGADVYGDKVVNQLLTLMSDVEKNGDDIYVIAATNRPEMLDEAISRSGRFGRKIEMKAPETLKDMLSIFNIHTKGKPLDEALNTEYFAKRLLDAKATGADVAYIVNKANENSLERSGIYAKMAKGTFVPSDMDGVKLLNADFEKAVDDFIAESKPQNRKPIGFVHYPQSNKGKSSIMA